MNGMNGATQRDAPLSGPALARRDRGARAHASGQAAEDQVLAAYERRGYRLVARRWRGRAGEIDLVLRTGETVVFVEVKRARDIDRAAARITPRQIARIFGAVDEFLGGEPAGALTDIRLDAALVDGTGRIEIRENAFA